MIERIACIAHLQCDLKCGLYRARRIRQRFGEIVRCRDVPGRECAGLAFDHSSHDGLIRSAMERA